MLRVCVLVLAVTNTVYGYSSGAPNDPGICKSLTPKHPGAPQTTASPYGLSVDKTNCKPGETVTLTISGTGTDKFKGYLVQARKTNSDENLTPYGSFKIDSGSKALSCSDMPDSSITHNSNTERDSATIQWIAPSEAGKYVLLCTVVKDGLTYWTRTKSQSITVG